MTQRPRSEADGRGFAVVLRYTCVVRGLSHCEVARRLGVEAITVERWCARRDVPTAAQVRALERALQLPAGRLSLPWRSATRA